MKVYIGDYPSPKSKKKRRIDITIHKWDSYSGYYTLAMIILPVLKDLKKNYSGVPSVIYPDDHFKKPQNEQDRDFKIYQKEWKRIIDTMIWSFNEIVNDMKGEKKAWKKNGKKEKWKKLDNDMIKLLETGYKFDKPIYDEYHKRVQEGLDNFAKYYLNLWW